MSSMNFISRILLLTLISRIAFSADVATNAVGKTESAPIALAGDSSPSKQLALGSHEDLGFDFYHGKTNKIARVYSADALSVFVIYEGDTGGRRIPRQDLPPELKAKYPFDAAKAAEYRKQQEDLSTQEALSAADRAAKQRTAQQKRIFDQMEALSKQDAELQKEKNILKGLPPGNGRRVRAKHINDQQESLRRQIAALREQLEHLKESPVR